MQFLIQVRILRHKKIKKNNTDEMMSEGKSPMEENHPSEVHSHEKVRKCYVQAHIFLIDGTWIRVACSFSLAPGSALHVAQQRLIWQRKILLSSA